MFYLSRIMGTSVTQIDATCGHLVPESEEYLRGLLDSYDVCASSDAEPPLDLANAGGGLIQQVSGVTL